MITHSNRTNSVTAWHSKPQEDCRSFNRDVRLWKVDVKLTKRNRKITTRKHLNLDWLMAPKSPGTPVRKGEPWPSLCPCLWVYMEASEVSYATCSREPRWCRSHLRYVHATCPPSEVKTAEPHSIASRKYPHVHLPW